ncbi:helix-turn-helix transcriptional regulator [Terricaulis sp.]|uniref:helix-turn-helix transcriptional regulator n=1 Tax=Terricaulis sp. TaxID=2768686 RepID=UPI003782E660
MLSRDAFFRLCRARDRLRDLDGGQPPVSEVARAAGLSEAHFIRLFGALFGESPHQCRIAARLDRARALLAGGEATVTMICFEVGFSSLGGFSALFSERTGMSPVAYRRKMRGRGPAPHCLELMTGAPAE